MRGRNMLTQAGVVTLLVTSCPIFLLVLPPSLLHVRASSLPSEPRCQFPKYLQTKKNKQWMMNLSNTLTTIDVDGGKIFARYGTCVRPRDYPRRRQSGVADCVKSNYTRLCLEKRRGNKYLVRHVESDFHDKFVCLEFLKRGISVVQVKMSLIQGESFIAHLCDDRFMNVDPWPWISEEHYRSPPVKCPFSGGYNLQLKYSSPPPAGRYRYYGSSHYSSSTSYFSDFGAQECMDSSTAPIRMESDCVTSEGVVFHFKHQSCLPEGTHLSLHQRALCMATWDDGNERFAMLRADNNDRAFFCLRVTMRPHNDLRNLRQTPGADGEEEDREIDEVVLYIGWVCPTSSYADATRRYSGTRMFPAPHVTPHMAFTVHDRHVITDPCSDELSVCHNHTSFCRRLQCMRTCGKCLPAAETTTTAAAADSLVQSRRGGGGGGGYDQQIAAAGHVSKKATVVSTSDRFAVRYAKTLGDGGLALAGEANSESMNGDDALDISKDGDYHHHNPDTAAGGGGGGGGGRSPERQSHQRRCTFPNSLRGTWLQRNTSGEDEKVTITESTFTHPRLGVLECVSFTPPGSEATPLRRVLWSRYDNGCYPRFTCLHYNTPAKSVMRYRLANVQHWPLVLSDDSICEERHFMEPPDMYQPGDKYEVRSWEVVRRSGHIHKMACILPNYLHKVVSFVDDRGISGCLVHGTYYSPRAITLIFFPKQPPKVEHSAKVRTGLGYAETRDVSGKNDDVEEGANPDLAAREGGYGAGGGKENRFNSGSQDEHHWTPGMSQEEKDYTYHRGSDPSKSEKFQGRDFDRSAGRGGGPDHRGLTDHDEWSEKLRGGYNQGVRVNHQFPPGMDDYELNKTYGHIVSESSPRGRFADRNDRYSPPYGSYSSDTKSHRQYKPYTYNNNNDNNDNNNDNDYYYYGNPRHRKIHGRGGHTAHVRHSVNGLDYYDGDSRRRYRRSGSDVRSRLKLSYDCLAVLTYVDSYKSLLTVTSGNPNEILCWLVIDESTLVILKTSSCNSQTAQRVLTDPAHNARHMEHVHRILRLGQGDRDCNVMFPADPVRPEPIKFEDDDLSPSGARASSALTSYTRVKLIVSHLVLTVVIIFLQR